MPAGMSADAHNLIHIPTEDGGLVAVRRYAGNGTPVIFLHGLAVNAGLWDLPDIRGRDYRYRSLSAMLREVGYDVWLVNLRGHGRPDMLSTPPPGETDWCVDHFILYDLPAVVERVRNETGRAPFIIGASMGAMTLAAYLQGARLEPDATPRRIVADHGIAVQRQRGLAGVVMVELPAVLRWPESLYDNAGRLRWTMLVRDWWRNDGNVNYPFEILARWGWAQAILAGVGNVPLSQLRGDPQRGPWYTAWPKPIAQTAERLEQAAMRLLLRAAGTFTGSSNHRAEVILHGRRYVVDDMKAGVLRQLAHCVRRGKFVSELSDPEHVYSDYYHLIDLPTLVVQGGRDRIANAEITRQHYFEVIRSSDKEWLFDKDIAHGEIEAAPIASQRLYPHIVQWIVRRDPRRRD